MPHNIYDDDAFFAGYSQLPRSRDGLAGAPEWPTVSALLPDLRDCRVLDLGCGFGAFDRWAIEQGASQVVAVDLSKRMLDRARQLTCSDQIRFVHADLADLARLPGEFDLVYSALVFHYIADFGALSRGMRARLRPGGRLVATIEHPIYTAPSAPQWQRRSDGHVFWPLEGYFAEGRRTTDWLTAGVVKYHRTLASYCDGLLCNGFAIRKLVEWVPDAQQLAANPQWSDEVHRPMFLIVSADAV